jgi:heavy metal sensor kinase
LTGRALQPVDRIGATANRISMGNLSERIDVAETDGELGRLAGVLNATFARLEAAFAQQRQFTANASHELRTPLAVIISETQTALARERSAEDYRETVQVCLQTAQQMRRLAESLMKLARFDAGQEILEQAPFDLAQVAQACVELVRPLAEANRLSLSTHLAPAKARGDADRCAQVVTNLLANAIQFNQPGGQIEVTTRVEGGLPTLLVRDTGQGIAAEDLPHIFERFYRADRSRSRRDGHAGLGLAIAKSIVEAHGGSISVVSTPGAGATFKVQLPAEPGKVV